MSKQDPRGGGNYTSYAKEIRKALCSVDTLLKVDFTKFCKEHGILSKTDGWRIIPPEEEVKRIADAMKQVLSKYGLDYENLDSIWPPYRQEVIDAARDAMQQIRQEKFQERINADLNELIKRDKPLFVAHDLTTTVASGQWLNAGDPEAIMTSYEDVKINANMIGQSPRNLSMLVSPMHTDWPSAHSKMSVSLPIHEIFQLPGGGTAIVTDRATFVTGQSSTYETAMINSYKSLLEEQGIELPQLNGSDGYRAVLDYYSLPEHALMDKLFNSSHSQEAQNIKEYLESENEVGRASAFLLSDPNKFITVINGGVEMQLPFSDIQPGMLVNLEYGQTEAMSLAGENQNQIFPTSDNVCVLGMANIDGEKVLITDAGILACRDLSVELGFDIGHSQSVDTPIIE